jgi:photosystem II stability/assembly factor-like uncharacterized protein
MRWPPAARLVGAMALTVVVAAAPVGEAQSVPVPREAPGSIERMRRLSSERGWVLTDNALLITGDGGVSWVEIARGPILEGLTDAVFLSHGLVRVVGVRPARPGTLVVLESIDGGESWQAREIETSTLAPGRTYVRARTRFVDETHGWLLGQVRTSSAFSIAELFITSDGGATWQRLPPPPAFGDFSFVDPKLGFMTGAPVSERLYRTRDGGRSWEGVELPVSGGRGMALYDLPMFHAPARATVAVTLRGDDPRVLTFETHDGGSSWLPVDSLALPAGDFDEPVPIAFDEFGRVAAVAAQTSIALRSDRTLRAWRLTPTVSAGSPAGARVVAVRSLSRAEDGSVWVLVAEGGCADGSCQQVTRVVMLDRPGPEAPYMHDLLVRIRAEPRAVKSSGASSKAGVISLDMGFDKCSAGTTAQMQTWREHGPYADANIYFGGAARACSQPYLDASWVTEVFAQGWRLIPTWVGPQAPCTGFIRRFNADPLEARSDGWAEADAAAAAAASLGLGDTTPLYYDFEYYDETDASCSEAVREFVNAWTERVREHGFLAGAYGNARNVHNDWIPSVIANPPDAVWLTPWVCGRTSTCDWTPTVFAVPGLEDIYWSDLQRIRQYWGPHTETYGGVTFEIDGDYANGPVAASSSESCLQVVAAGHWKGEYFDNTNLTGGAVMVRDDGTGDLDFNWGPESPSVGCGVPSNRFSVRWSRTVHFNAGTYRFTVTGDDGLRLSIDGVVEIDEWRGQPPTTFRATVDLPSGAHTIGLEYYEDRGGALARVSWEQLSGVRRVRARHGPP